MSTYLGREMALAMDRLDTLIDSCPDDFRLHMGTRWADRFMVLDGEELARYRVFREACKLAQETALAHSVARDQLRASIEELGRLIAPAPKAE